MENKEAILVKHNKETSELSGVSSFIVKPETLVMLLKTYNEYRHGDIKTATEWCSIMSCDLEYLQRLFDERLWFK